METKDNTKHPPQEATMKRAKACVQPMKSNPVVKRKVGYETIDDDMMEARRGMVNITMNERADV